MKFIKILKVAILCLFVVFFAQSFSGPKDSDQSFKNVRTATLKNVDTSELEKQDNKSIKRFLGLYPESYEKVCYYKSTDPMKADEIVIVKFKTDDQHELFEDTVQTRIDQQYNVFSGYAPLEADKLKNAIIDIQANYAIYIVHDDCTKIDDSFVESLK